MTDKNKLEIDGSKNNAFQNIKDCNISINSIDNIEEGKKGRANKYLDLIKEEKLKFYYVRKGGLRGSQAFYQFKNTVVRVIIDGKSNYDKTKKQLIELLNNEQLVPQFKVDLIYEFFKIVNSFQNKENKKDFVSDFNINLSGDEKIYIFCLLKFKENKLNLLNYIGASDYITESFKTNTIEWIFSGAEMKIKMYLSTFNKQVEMKIIEQFFVKFKNIALK